jgi:transcriptional regulator with XRE-family HTH domain
MRRAPSDVLRSVGRRIAELRRDHGLTQEQLGARLQVSEQYLRRIELGSQNVTLRTLANVANALRVDVAALFEAPRPGSRAVRQGRPRKTS